MTKTLTSPTPIFKARSFAFRASRCLRLQLRHSAFALSEFWAPAQNLSASRPPAAYSRTLWSDAPSPPRLNAKSLRLAWGSLDSLKAESLVLDKSLEKAGALRFRPFFSALGSPCGGGALWLCQSLMGSGALWLRQSLMGAGRFGCASRSWDRGCSCFANRFWGSNRSGRPPRFGFADRSGRSARSGERGFTLVEILIVVALMALVFAAALPGIGSAIRASIENGSREMATTIRSAFDESILKGRVCRVVFDLDKNQYWVEQGPVNFLLMTAEQKEELARSEARLTKEEIEAKPKPSFGMATAVTRNKINLPAGVSFTDVISSLSKEPVKGGIVYAHIFPHGFIEKVTIHLKDLNQHEATLFVNPVSGRSKLYHSYVKETQK